MCKLTKQLMTMIDQKDQTQKLIGLLAQATDNEFTDLKQAHKDGLKHTADAFSELKKTNEEHYVRLQTSVAESLSKIQESIDKHNLKCPFGMETDVKDLEKRVDKFKWIETLQDFPLVGKIFIIGLGLVLLLGINKLAEYLNVIN